MVNLAAQQTEPGAKAAMHPDRSVEDGDELRAPNGRLAFVYDGLWVGQIGGEKTGRVSKSKKTYALLRVVPRSGGGFDIAKIRTLDKSVIESLSLSKRIHGDKSLSLFPVPGKVGGEPCQLITL